MDDDAASGRISTIDRTSTHREPWSLRRTARLLFSGARRPMWRNARVLTVSASIDPSGVREWLPPLVRFGPSPRATLFLADYPDTSFGVAYRECGLLLHVRYLGREFLHCAWMVVDDDAALILGRELLGFPKKMARIDVSDHGGSVERQGIDLIRLEGASGEEVAAPVPPFPRPILNVRGLPGAASGLLLRLRAEQTVHRARRFSGRLRIGSSDVDPLDRLRLSEEVEGTDAVLDMGFPGRMGVGSVLPVGLVSPAWMIRSFPFRTW